MNNEVAEDSRTLHEIDRRLASVEGHLDDFLSYKRWIMTLVSAFVLQIILGAFAYGKLWERVDNIVVSLENATDSRYYRFEGKALERRVEKLEEKLDQQLLQ